MPLSTGGNFILALFLSSFSIYLCQCFFQNALCPHPATNFTSLFFLRVEISKQGGTCHVERLIVSHLRETKLNPLAQVVNSSKWGGLTGEKYHLRWGGFSVWDGPLATTDIVSIDFHDFRTVVIITEYSVLFLLFCFNSKVDNLEMDFFVLFLLWCFCREESYRLKTRMF